MFSKEYALSVVFVKGEISNCKYHSSGHIYFSLKDDRSQLTCVMFRGDRGGLDFRMENGQEVVVGGSISVYERDGKYQLYAKKIVPVGDGHLQEQYEKLKKKLEAAGYFDEDRKLPIPKYVKKVGIVTAKTGAAVHDMIQIATRRNPYVQLYLYPAKVQGEGAAQSIAGGISFLDEFGVDVILAGRGGGSMEDLWAFNEEPVIEAVFAAKTPVISAVGHETDFTICDFVSDYRSATPTAAAVKATPNQKELRVYQENLQKQLLYKMKHRLDVQRQYLSRLQQSYYLSNPEVIYSHEFLRLTKLQDKLSYQFKVFDMRVYQKLTGYQAELKNQIDLKLQAYEHQLRQYITTLDALSPLKVLQRGYTLIHKEKNMIKKSKDLKTGDIIDIQFQDGHHKAEIK